MPLRPDFQIAFQLLDDPAGRVPDCFQPVIEGLGLGVIEQQVVRGVALHAEVLADNICSSVGFCLANSLVQITGMMAENLMTIFMRDDAKAVGAVQSAQDLNAAIARGNTQGPGM